MAGRSGIFGAGIVVLTLAGSACGYDRGSSPTGPGYGDTTAMAATPAIPVAPAAGLQSDELKRVKRATARYHPDGVFSMNNARVP